MFRQGSQEAKSPSNAVTTKAKGGTEVDPPLWTQALEVDDLECPAIRRRGRGVHMVPSRERDDRVFSMSREVWDASPVVRASDTSA